MDAQISLPMWAHVAIGLSVFYAGRFVLAQLLDDFTDRKVQSQRERHKRESEALAAAEIAAFWAEGPSTVAEALYWQSFGRFGPSDIATIRAMLEGNNEQQLREHLASDRFLLPAVEAARAAGVPIADRRAWISTKVQKLKDDFNADPANKLAPWQ